jgi:hypothetical protein
MKPAEAARNRLVVVLRGNAAGAVGRVVGRDAANREHRLLVSFAGKKFPRDFRSIGVENVREASAVEALLFGEYRWCVRERKERI